MERVRVALILQSSMLPDYDFAILRNTEDNDVIKFLKLFTELDLNEIKKLSNLKA